MSPKNLTDEEAFELLLLGMMWRTVQKGEEGDVLLQRCNAILATYSLTQVITAGQRDQLSTSSALATKIAEECERCYAGRKAVKTATKVAETSDQHLLLLLGPRELLSHGLLLAAGNHAYRVVITQKGIRFAETLAPKYRHLVTKEQFLAAWVKRDKFNLRHHADAADGR